MERPPVIHPFLLAMFPIASLLSHNIERVSASQILLPSAVVLGFTSLSVLLLKMVLTDDRKAGIIVSAFVVPFFSYGHVFALTQRLHNRYASTLQEQFHFDNSDFTDYLTSKGFYIASEARADYPTTWQSLAASLNIKHLTYLANEVRGDTSDQTIVHRMLQNHELWRFLESRGYRYMHFGS